MEIYKNSLSYSLRDKEISLDIHYSEYFLSVEFYIKYI